MDWKRIFLESSLLGQSTQKTSPSDVQRKCVELAYRDMMTAGRYYYKYFLSDKKAICSYVINLIKTNDYIFSRDLIESTASKIGCEKIENDNRYVTGYGLAQKIINMTFKYLYVFSDYVFPDDKVPDFSFCDCPLDSIILEKASLNYTWSKLNKKEYEDCQRKITKLLQKEQANDDELKQLGNMAYDFLFW